MSTVYAISDEDRERWRRHNLDDLLRSRAMSFEEKLRWLEEAQKTARWFEDRHRLKARPRGNDAARAAEQPPPSDL